MAVSSIRKDNAFEMRLHMARNNLSANTALDEKGLTGLHLAAMLGKPAVVASLAGDADVNLQNKNGWTALMLAARNGYLEIVQMLLRAGADPGLAARNGATARSFAKRNRHSEVVLLLVLDKAWPRSVFLLNLLSCYA